MYNVFSFSFFYPDLLSIFVNISYNLFYSFIYLIIPVFFFSIFSSRTMEERAPSVACFPSNYRGFPWHEIYTRHPTTAALP